MIYDADCALCDGTVDFVLRHERANGPQVRFVGSHSEAARWLLAENGLQIDLPDRTVVVIEDGQAFLRSDAAIALARHLRAPWSMGRFLKLVPHPVRDWAYDRVALNRYRLFGRLDQCRLVTPDLKDRFPQTLDELRAV